MTFPSFGIHFTLFLGCKERISSFPFLKIGKNLVKIYLLHFSYTKDILFRAEL